jgi:hypothetical protein
MEDDSVERGRSDPSEKPHVVRTTIDPDPQTAEHDLLEIIADLEGCAIDELPSFYTEADHFVEILFENPPSPAAQMEITFSYAGYRVTMNWRGDVELVAVKRSIVEE